MLALVTALLGGVASGAAQERSATLSGTVTADGRPLVNAQIVVVGTGIGILTRSGGHFRLPGIPPGRQHVEVRYLGYRTEQLVLQLEAGRTFRVQVELALDPVPLEEVEVDGTRALLPELRGFYERRARGFGYFLTREQLDELPARLFTDVMRQVPGVQVLPVNGRSGTGYVAQTGRAAAIGRRPCPVVYYVNGVVFSVDVEMGINSFVRPDDIAALEVYTGASRIPPQFNSSVRDSRCGVAVIWTRAGERRRASAH